MDLITDHLDIWTTVQATKTVGRGKRTNNQSIYGIKKLRELIQDLAVRGKLVPQNLVDESANTLLQKIAREKNRLVKAGKIKKLKPLLKKKGVSPIGIDLISGKQGIIRTRRSAQSR